MQSSCDLFVPSGGFLCFGGWATVPTLSTAASTRTLDHVSSLNADVIVLKNLYLNNDIHQILLVELEAPE